MAQTRLIPYEPDYPTKPGEVLEEYLAVRGMTKAELAARCGRPTKTVSEIIHGKAAITPDTALQLERVLGRPASLWQNLEANYRLHLAIRAEADLLASHAAWAKRFPVKEMVGRRCIDAPTNDTDRVKKVLAFFGVGTPAGWKSSFGDLQLAFRRSPAFKATTEAVTTWIRLGEIAADKIDTAPFDKVRFKEVLGEIRGLTVKPFPDVRNPLVAMCASAGVAVAFVPELPKTHVSGIARWLSKDKALIQLSLRYKSSDHLWFSFFHEAGHILLHSKKLTFLDENDGDPSAVEQDANRFAADTLIPVGAFGAFRRTGDFSATAVNRFASALGIAPGIIVGRLQHDALIKFSMHNSLKEPLDWASRCTSI
jgi:HTH-type transcriptional regulator/antitoxin HigA